MEAKSECHLILFLKFGEFSALKKQTNKQPKKQYIIMRLLQFPIIV